MHFCAIEDPWILLVPTWTLTRVLKTCRISPEVTCPKFNSLSTFRGYVNLLMQRVSRTIDYIRKCCHLLNLGKNITIDNKNNI